MDKLDKSHTDGPLTEVAINMDISRIHNPTKKDMDRLARYKKEYRQILEYLGDVD